MATITKTITRTVTIHVSNLVSSDFCAPNCPFFNIIARGSLKREECILYKAVIINGLRLHECMNEFGVEVDNAQNIA